MAEAPQFPEQLLIDKCISIAIEVAKKIHKDDHKIGAHELYEESTEMAESISYHSVKGKFPEKLFKHRSPNQTDKEAAYIRDNYKQHTLPVFLDYISTITRPFGDGNWSIDYRDDEESYKSNGLTLQDYVEHHLPKYGSLEAFVKTILPTIKTIDSNGFVTVRPETISYKDGENGEKVVDSQKLYEPTIFFFSSKNTIDYCPGEYYLFLSTEKSEVRTHGGLEKSGVVFELYTDNVIYFIKQHSVKSEYRFQVEEFLRHDLEDCQVQQLKGIPTIKGDKILWQSPFLFATDLLDLVAMNANFLQALINSSVFPVKVMYGSPCEFLDTDSHQRCIEGRITIDGKERTCPSCNGIGLKSRVSPLGTLLLNPKTKFNDGETQSNVDPLKYISPETHTLDFLSKKIELDTDKSRKILHLQTSNSEVKGSENMTATGMAIDNKAMYAFIKPISDQIFSIYEFLLNAIGQQRYKEALNPPSMTYPKTFDFKSSEDYLNDISSAIKNNLPPAFIQLLLMQYINSYYGDNEKSTRVFRLAMASDRLFGLSQDEINMKIARGSASKWEDILHTSCLNFITESIAKDEKFIDKKIEDQVVIIQDMAKAKQAEIEGKPINDLMGITLPQGGGNALKESVGGLTGMIEIAKAVASGLYDLEAAVALVSDRFGLTPEEARKQLGSPQLIQSEQQADKVAKLT